MLLAMELSAVSSLIALQFYFTLTHVSSFASMPACERADMQAGQARAVLPTQHLQLHCRQAAVVPRAEGGDAANTQEMARLPSQVICCS